MPNASHPDDVLRELSRRAPSGPGVYVLLDRATELLYVGKASDLRRRLLDHAKARWASRVRDVRWIECTDEEAALCLEADLIVGLAPALNKVMTHDESMYIGVDATASGLRFRLTVQPVGGRAYGAFPHLGKGKVSWRAVRTNGGYTALLRLLWVTFAGDRLPARLRGTSPPVDHRMPFDHAQMGQLHDLLSGRSNRISKTLRVAVADADDFMRGPLERDLAAADAFYRLGPRALRDVRVAHGLRPGPVDRATFARVVACDLEAAIGPFSAMRAMMGVS